MSVRLKNWEPDAAHHTWDGLTVGFIRFLVLVDMVLTLSEWQLSGMPAPEPSFCLRPQADEAVAGDITVLSAYAGLGFVGLLALMTATMTAIVASPPATSIRSRLTALTAGVAPSRIWPYMYTGKRRLRADQHQGRVEVLKGHKERD